MTQRIREAVVRIARADAKQTISLPLLEKSLLPILSLASVFYSAALSIRRVFYRYGLVSPTRLPVPVVSVGNITWGGNGKTPMVEFLCGYFLQAGICPLILTRGYAGGDEARLLQNHLEGSCAKIGVGPNRTTIARFVLQKYGIIADSDREQIAQSIETSRNAEPLLMCLPQQDERVGVILLDDGMQHWQLTRDLEIVMVNLITVWGNEQMVPRGPLRESLQELKRADIIVLHHADLVSEETIENVKRILGQVMKADAVMVFSRMAPRYLFTLPASTPETENIQRIFQRPGKQVSLDALKGSVVLSVTGVGCPESVSLILQKMGASYIESMDYLDHHKFQAKELNNILLKYVELQQSFPNSSVLLVLTEKDYVRDPAIWRSITKVKLLVLRSSLEILPMGNGLEALASILLRTVRGSVMNESQLGSSFWTQALRNVDLIQTPWCPESSSNWIQSFQVV